MGRRSRLEGTAYHEAGHAVLCYMFGHKIVRLSIKAKETADGVEPKGKNIHS